MRNQQPTFSESPDAAAADAQPVMSAQDQAAARDAIQGTMNELDTDLGGFLARGRRRRAMSQAVLDEAARRDGAGNT